MLGAHKLSKFAAGCAIGLGALLPLAVPASAMEVPVIAPSPYQLVLPPYGKDGTQVYSSISSVLSESSTMAIDGPAGADHGPNGFPARARQLRGPGAPVEIARVAVIPIPGTVWLFLAALALLFGISRRNNTAAR